MAVLEAEVTAAPNPYSFTLPDNFTPPEGYEEGKPFDAVVSMILSNGQMTLNSINGTPLAQAEEVEEEEAVEPMEEDMAEDEMAAEDGGSTLASEIQNYRSA